MNLTDFVAADTALGLMDKDHEYDSVMVGGREQPVQPRLGLTYGMTTGTA